MLPFDAITLYRRATFRTQPEERLQSIEQAAEFVQARGFIYFWPIEAAPLPSLWAATAGDRPVPDDHDDPGHVTWGWKDQALGGSWWYYAKLIRKKGTMVSHAVLPYFYALSENYGSPEDDYLTVYEQGRLTVEAKTIYEVLLERGPLDTIELRKACRKSSGGPSSNFDRAITDLQADFRIAPVGVSDAGGWHYAFIYDCVHRRYPDLPEQARPIGEGEARQALMQAYFASMGGASQRDLVKLFGWRPPAIQGALNRLAQAGVVRCDVEVEGQKEPWTVLQTIVD